MNITQDIIEIIKNSSFATFVVSNEKGGRLLIRSSELEFSYDTLVFTASNQYKMCEKENTEARMVFVDSQAKAISLYGVATKVNRVITFSISRAIFLN